MTCALLISNSILLGLMQEALKQASIEFEVIENKTVKAVSPHFCIIKEENNNGSLFSMVMDSETEDQDDGKKLYLSPVRLGEVCGEIIYHAKQREIRKLLKPIQIGSFTLLPQENIIEDQKEKFSVKLTDKEMDILIYLFHQSPQKVTRSEMLHHIWRYSEGIETHTLETHIYRLRQKIEKNPTDPKILITDDDGYYLQL